ncbi:hypothetical protein FB388_5937 [Pseudonocardia cypriaca]|uniref:Uncharacterized protein n=1 Tax=Pseudonocardia cypriaca TaxID=882449 RepID=A0A543FXX0_9PSEU|nr:hypothetical protein FB388_5937 [Pseudonocardia cypriaca]
MVPRAERGRLVGLPAKRPRTMRGATEGLVEVGLDDAWRH